MKFGRTELPKGAALHLPPDHAITAKVLPGKAARTFTFHTGGSKWSLKDLVGPVYPKGTKAKDMLTVYASLFNAIELNATRYGNFPPGTWAKWVAETPADFRFCPKVHQSVAQIRRLQNVEEVFRQYLDSIAHAGDKLGPMLLQMPENFGPEHMDRLEAFAPLVPKGWQCAVEMRYPGWMERPVLDQLMALLAKHRLGAVITDSPARRDMVHMGVTAPFTFVRFVSSSDEARDAGRLEAWIERIGAWRANGLQEAWFFVHEETLERLPRWTAELMTRLGKPRKSAKPTLFDQ